MLHETPKKKKREKSRLDLEMSDRRRKNQGRE